MDLSLDDDLTLFDGAEPITYVHIEPSAQTSISIASALKRAITRDEARLLAPQIAVTPEDVAWHLAAQDLTEIVPRAGDRIIAAETQWIVLAAAHVTLQSRWRLYCRQAR